MNPINVTAYQHGRAIEVADYSDGIVTLAEAPASGPFTISLKFTPQRPGGHRKMKIHLVETAGSADRLVKAHTKAGAERYVRDSIKPTVTARVPSQEELIKALRDGVEIEDATNSPQASIPEPAQNVEQIFSPD